MQPYGALQNFMVPYSLTVAKAINEPTNKRNPREPKQS